MARRMYISKGYDSDAKTLDMDVPDSKFFDEVSIGDEVEVTVKGTVKSLEAPHEGEDYDKPYKEGKSRPKKIYPGKMCLELNDDPAAQKLVELDDSMIGDE